MPVNNNDYFIGTARELLDVISRYETETQKLMSQALEALSFMHRYKKFFVTCPVARLDSGKYKINEFSVMDFNERACAVSIYYPQGGKRTTAQLEFKYNYDLHMKEPKNVRRTSDLRKIEKCVHDIKPITELHIGKVLSYEDLSRLSGCVRKTSKIRESEGLIERLHSKLGYGGASDKKILEHLVKGTTSVDSEEFKKNYIEALSQCDAARVEYDELSRCKVRVSSNYCGEYALAYAINAEDCNELKIYPSRDELPDAIKGKMAVLDIIRDKDRNDDRTIEGVGYVRQRGLDYDHQSDFIYYVIGKDIDDPRAQSQGQGI